MKKIFIYAGIVLLLLVLVGGTFIKYTGSSISDKDNQKQSSPELDKYRSEDIPEECRLPGYEENLDWWKQHLSHHSQTLYCLDYYK